jgi:CO/xanthine dehydrogenase Mo-binding subunit
MHRYSITSSARASSVGGMVRPSALAVLRLMRSSSFAIDAVARHLKLDQIEVRRKNFVQPTEFPYRPYGSTGVMYDSGNYQGLLDKALAAFDYEGRRSECQALRGSGIYRGIGVAAYTHMCGMAPSRRLAVSGFDRGGWESARVSIDSSGRATIYSGSQRCRRRSRLDAGLTNARVANLPCRIATVDIA